MTQQENENHWSLDKKVPISIILMLLLQGISGLWVIADIKKDVEILKAALVIQANRDERQDRSSTDAVSLVRQDIQEVSRKVDRLIERGSR